MVGLEVLGSKAGTSTRLGRCRRLNGEAVVHHSLALPVLAVLLFDFLLQRQAADGVTSGIDGQVAKTDFLDLDALLLHLSRKLQDKLTTLQSLRRNSDREAVGIDVDVVGAILVAKRALTVNLSLTHALEEGAIWLARNLSRMASLQVMGMSRAIRMVRLMRP